MLTRIVYDAVSLVEPHPGCGALLATVADYHPAGDSVAVHHLPHACTQLPHVSPTNMFIAAKIVNFTYLSMLSWSSVGAIALQ